MCSRTTDLLSITQTYNGRIADVVYRRVLFSTGEDIEYEVIHRPEIVVVIPVDPENRIIMLHQYRASLDRYIWEFPAGSIEDREKPVDAAIRELEEETGRRASKLRLIYEFYTAPHFSDEKAYVFVAEDLIPGQAHPEEKEFITLHLLSITEIEAKCTTGEILDAKTLAAYYAFRRTEK